MPRPYGLHNFELVAFSTWVVPLVLFSGSLQDWRRWASSGTSGQSPR